MASTVARRRGRQDSRPTGERLYPSSNHRFVNTEINCTGLEPNITDCIQNLDEAYSCLSFGIASVSCHSKFTTRAFPPSEFSNPYLPQHLQLGLLPMHPALMVECDSAMATSQERAGWRSVSTMPGALSVMMDGTMQMLQ